MIVLNVSCSVTGTSDAGKPESLIRSLYEEHQPQKGKEISFDDTKTLNRYFTENLTGLFLRNEECRERTHEDCYLSSDPILYAQDYDDSPRNLEVKEIMTTESLLQFKVTFTNMKHRVTLIYEVIKTKSGWRISDIIYPSKNRLTELLSQPE